MRLSNAQKGFESLAEYQFNLAKVLTHVYVRTMPYKDPIKQSEVQHQYYLNKKEIYRLRRNAYRSERREYIQSLKDVPCMDCGNRFPVYCMDFDHRDPTQKRWGVGQNMGLSLDKVLEEINKCDVVCANCHRVRTFGKNLPH